jgi:hypothetical protein
LAGVLDLFFSKAAYWDRKSFANWEETLTIFVVYILVN